MKLPTGVVANALETNVDIDASGYIGKCKNEIIDVSD
jgi:hypothetical protein